MTDFLVFFISKKSNTPSVKTAFFAKKGSFTEGVFYEKGETFGVKKGQ